MSNEDHKHEDEYLKTMLARRDTIKQAKHSNIFNIESEMKTEIAEQESALDKAYNEVETPESFEATPAMTFVIIISLISIV